MSERDSVRQNGKGGDLRRIDPKFQQPRFNQHLPVAKCRYGEHRPMHIAAVDSAPSDASWL
jgi:hypothetical protein